MLAELGAPDWETDAVTGGEKLTEIMGRLCYKSFGTELNPNVTKVREGNAPYIENVLKVKHGSVIEHASVSFILTNVSRILTHELVRHRAGTAFSQESQRFVRLDAFDIYVPALYNPLRELANYVIADPMEGKAWNAETVDRDKEANSKTLEHSRQQWANKMSDMYMATFEALKQETQEEMVTMIEQFQLDKPEVPFHVKKEITSALRRIVMGGVLTNIGVTANHRAWRYIIEQRTALGAEEEIRLVMGDIAATLKHNFYNLYQDFTRRPDGSWVPLYSKV
jgi:thymidylate synthase (FAD)